MKWVRRDSVMDRWQQVVLKAAASNCKKFTSGNPQKSVLGSTFFKKKFKYKEMKYEFCSFYEARKRSLQKKKQTVFFIK